MSPRRSDTRPLSATVAAVALAWSAFAFVAESRGRERVEAYERAIAAIARSVADEPPSSAPQHPSASGKGRR